MEDEKLKLEALLKADEKSFMLNKLSATLSAIEESFICVEDGNRTCADESPGNATSVINTTFGVPLEVVEEMKNQLLCLQERLVNFNPEEFERMTNEINELKGLNAKLIEKGESLAKVRVEEEKSLVVRYEKLLEEKEETLKAKHKTEIGILSTKMQEEMNFNIPALEERLRIEYDEKIQGAVKSASAKFDEDMQSKEKEIVEYKQKLAEANELLKSKVQVECEVDTFPSQQNTTLGLVPGRCVE